METLKKITSGNYTEEIEKGLDYLKRKTISFFSYFGKEENRSGFDVQDDTGSPFIRVRFWKVKKSSSGKERNYEECYQIRKGDDLRHLINFLSELNKQ